MPDGHLLEAWRPGATGRAAAERRAGGAWRAWLRDPLAHFLLLAAALFLLWPLLPPPAPSNRIVITQADMQRAVEIFVKTHDRAPNSAELADLAEQQIQSEVEYREGLALGLDRDDEIIRRRIAQKLRFMIQDVVEQSTPTDADLQRFLQAHPEEFGAEPSIAFSQVYLNPSRHAGTLPGDAGRLLQRLNHADGRLDYAADSDVLPVPNDFEATPLHVIAAMFGEDFASAVATQKPGAWLGPVTSGYGEHLVLVRQKIAGAAPQLAQVRHAVLREYQSAQRIEANAAAYRQMRAKYDIRVELPAASVNAGAQ
jgi:hypothetical protein